MQDVEYNVAHRNDHFFITLRDQERPNSELRVAPLDRPTDQLVSTSWLYTVHWPSVLNALAVQSLDQ